MLRGNVSQSQFAQKYGLSKNTLWGYEAGSSDPKMSFVRRLIEDTGVDANWLLFGTGEPPTPTLTPREAALLDNYRHSPEDARRNLETTSSLLAQRGGVEEGAKGKKTG
jgi:transcriptional regulator with XRE-family HTH domain